MNPNKITETGKFYTINCLKIPVVDIEPCYRCSAIGKGIPQYCQCSNCVDRGDFGKLIKVTLK